MPSRLTLNVLMSEDKNTTTDIVNAKIQNGVPLKFNEVRAADLIEAGEAKMDDYSKQEQSVVQLEIQRRA